jgi:S1-C subfamily serine protease
MFRMPGWMVAALGLVPMLAAGCSANRLWAPSREDILQRILPTAVHIAVVERGGERVKSGSGVAIGSRATKDGESCFILTLGRIVSGLSGDKQLFVTFGRYQDEGEKVPATLVADRGSQTLDLALIRAKSAQCAPASLGHPPELGESIMVIGFPWGRHMTLARGIVSQINLDDDANQDTAPRLTVDASVSYGINGGGVYDMRDGGLIGLVEGYNTARVSSQGATPTWQIDVPVPGQTFVTPLADVKRFLKETGHADLTQVRDLGDALLTIGADRR